MSEDVLFTVFTPTYNRAHTLPRTYQSLKRQDSKCFEWLIIDDGSTDKTKELVVGWQKENNGFAIRYIYKTNGGMHTAYNLAYKNISTELNVCIDSDDCLAPGAARIIKEHWNQVRDKKYAGMVGLDADLNTGRIIGSGFPNGLTEITYSEFYSEGGSGDIKFVLRTDVINKYPPYPEFAGEDYVGIGCKYVLIDQDYKLSVLNSVLCNVEYQPDGHSKSMYQSYLNNPKGFAYYRKTMMQYPISRKKLLQDTVHYVSSSFLSGNKSFIRESPHKVLTILMVPFGLILTRYIKFRAHKVERVGSHDS